jgi:hypothetical protein
MNAIARPGKTGSPEPTTRLGRKSLDQLEKDIIALSQHINATEYEFLVMLREFDLRQGWKAYNFNNCAEWLNMKCGMCPRTAREKLRVANGLFDLPTSARAFQKGDLSYSKARSLTRAATPETEAKLLDFALKANAAHVDRHCTQMRNARPAVSGKDARRIHAERFLSYTPCADGSVQFSARLSGEDAGLIIRALEMATPGLKGADAEYFEDGRSDEELSEYDDDGPRGPSRGRGALPQSQADALVELARAYLAGREGSEIAGEVNGDIPCESESTTSGESTGIETEGTQPDSRAKDISRRSCTADHYQVTIHVDEKALRGAPDEHSRSGLPIETVRRLCCDGAIVPLVENEAGKPMGLGRKHRVVNPSLKRALMARDRGCRFPGCTHGKWLDAHHVVHWADGGTTTPDNLVILCSSHHRLLHEGGFEIRPGPDGEWQFRRPDARRYHAG